MQITDIYIKDFLSFGTEHLQLPKAGLVLVTGLDLDLGRANGAGKSTIFNALAWCLYGELPKDIKVDELVRRGQNACMVAVKFTIDGVNYIVTRKRPSGLDLTIGKEKQKGNPKFLQALIEQAIGLSYKQFLITSYFPQKGDASRFLKQNDATAKDFLGTILNFNKTEAAYKKLHLEIKEVGDLISLKRGELNSAESSVSKFEHIANMAVPAMPDKELVLSAKKELDALELSTKTPPETTAIDQEIERVAQAVQKVQRARYEIQTMDRRLSEIQHGIQRLDTWTAHHLTCPECSAELIESGGKLVTFDDSAAEDVRQSKIKSFENERDLLIEKKAKLQPMVDKEAQFSKKLDDAKQKRQQARHDYEMAMQRKSHVQSQIANFRQAIMSAQQAKLQKDEVVKQLNELKQSVIVKKEELKKLEQDLLLLSAAKSVMSPTGAIAYSLDNVMSDINEEVGQYLDIFSHNTMTYKLTSGDDKAKVTHSVIKGEADVSVGSLSGGEERGLILSVDLGLSEVIATRSGVSLPSVLMLDECFEGLDAVGKEKVIDALREIANDRCIIVIDHSTEFSALFDQSIKVVKQNEISRLEVS